MENFVYYNSLFDIYGDLLTDKEKENFCDYYQEDLSLSEIAESKNISRSAVQKTVKVVIEKLEYYESKLHIFKNNEVLRESLDLQDINKIKNNIKEVLK